MSIRVERRTQQIRGKTVPVNIRPASHETVKVKTCGNVKEVMYSQNRGRGGCTKKISKEEYVNIRTGEVKQFQKQEKRSDDKISVARTMKLGRDLINTNVTDPNKCRWITLTYAKNMQDTKKLYNDFKYFRKKLKKIYGHTEYITAAEPQARGAWHLHVILIFPEKAPYIPNETLRELWGHGFVRVTALTDVDNVGAYLTAYLGNIPLNEFEEAGKRMTGKQTVKDCIYLEEDGTEVSKRVVKGARLDLYPAGMQIFRQSRGLRKPEVKYCSEEKAAKEVSDMTMTYETTKFLTDEDTGYFNIINYRFYTKRKTGAIIYEYDDLGSYERVQGNPHEKSCQGIHLYQLQCKH